MAADPPANAGLAGSPAFSGGAMSRRERLWISMLLIALAATAAPAQAADRPWSDFEGIWSWLRELAWQSVQTRTTSEQGGYIDPNGGSNATSDEGFSIDPDGGSNTTSDQGFSIDPNGGSTATSDEGLYIDPNG